MQFLSKIITELLNENEDLGGYTMILPGKRPIVFIKNILEEKGYSGFLPNFITIDDLIIDIADVQLIEGISLWLNAYHVYQNSPINQKDEFNDFLKWFPTLVKDWDDILKFSESDQKVLNYMLDEERIKNWAQNLGDENAPRRKFLDFWKNMNVFLPLLKKHLVEQNWATSGMLHELARNKADNFVDTVDKTYVFCGFNALTPIEELLIQKLLKNKKAYAYFQADQYYMNFSSHEAGKFLRKIKDWSLWSKEQPFSWIENDFNNKKEINVYEVSGNVTQTKILPNILDKCRERGDDDLSNTAVILLDENLLPTSLDAISNVDYINITMGFPIKNLKFSNAIKAVFHLQKQATKKASIYYKDLLAVLELFPTTDNDVLLIQKFITYTNKRNIIYYNQELIRSYLAELSFYSIIEKSTQITEFLNKIILLCQEIKVRIDDDIQYENISHFEDAFRVIKNQLTPFSYTIDFEILEILLNYNVDSETIDFQGEPLQGLQIMGLLETRLLTFDNIILLSVNEGKLPLGNTQNTYLPYDVREHFGMHTFLDNDGIYAYHFYRLLQNATNIHLMYNALSSGVNTGEKSRFIRQLELESSHKINNTIVENLSKPIHPEPVTIEKTPLVVDKLNTWKNRVSVSHLITYLYNPINFYNRHILNIKEIDEIEDELSIRNYGNLVHYTLEYIYMEMVGMYLTKAILKKAYENINEKVEQAIQKLNHQEEYYKKGINYLHKEMAIKVIQRIIKKDLDIVSENNQLKILSLEKRFDKVELIIDEDNSDSIYFNGYIDRIDELNGTIRIIDYKTAKTKNLTLSITDKNIDDYLNNYDRRHAIQLLIYEYAVSKMVEFKGKPIEIGIWSFNEVEKGLVPLIYRKGTLEDAFVSINSIVKEILNPAIPFAENITKKNH